MGNQKKISLVLRNLDLCVAGAALAFLIALTIVGVLMRYAVNRPIYWMEEVQLWCFVWVVFLGSCAVARTNAHIAIDAIISLFPAPARRAAAFFALVVSIAALAFLGYYSCFHVLQMYERARLTNILGIPFALIYAVVPLSCLVIIATCIRQMAAGREDK